MKGLRPRRAFYFHSRSPSFSVGIDLTYEGIATLPTINTILVGLIVGIDLTYEGIATRYSGWLLSATSAFVGIDLTYEGIATCSGYNLKVANEAQYVFNIHMLPNLPFTHIKNNF